MAKPHIKLPVLTQQQIERFLVKVPHGSENECWEWKGYRDKAGYGGWQPFKGAHRYVTHRIAYFLHFAADPLVLGVLHRCDNPPCCNPSHLFLGTNADNSADRVSKGRSARGLLSIPKRVRRGEAHHMAKLSNDEVLEIRRRYIPYRYSLNRVAREFNISKRAVLYIVQGKHWSHI